MNIVGTMVGMSLMASKRLTNGHAIWPLRQLNTSKRKQQNFGVAETAAVVFAATYEGTTRYSCWNN